MEHKIDTFQINPTSRTHNKRTHHEMSQADIVQPNISDIQDQVESLTKYCRPCEVWTKRDFCRVTDDPNSSFELEDYYVFFRTILNLEPLDITTDEGRALAKQNPDDALELWQINKRLDLVYYYKGERKLRAHLRKRQLYKTNDNIFPQTTNDKVRPMIESEHIMNFDLLCIAVCQAVDNVNNGNCYYR
jgi:hypothetical protein